MCRLNKNVLPRVVVEAVIAIPIICDRAMGALSSLDSSLRISVHLKSLNGIFLPFLLAKDRELGWVIVQSWSFWYDRSPSLSFSRPSTKPMKEKI